MNEVFSNKKRIINNKKNWQECPKCNFQFEKYNKYKKCNNCGYNFKMSSEERLEIICDDNSFNEIDFKNKNLHESILIGKAKIDNKDVAIGIMNSYHMAGSIGEFLIKKLCYLIKFAKRNKLPLIIFSASGGIRVQEGVKALVGMSKLAEAINEYKEDGLFISFLTNPTYGGLNASLSMLGDIIISEYDCKIGFSGTRVIKNELLQELPENFQTTEFCFENGLIDMIVSRDQEKEIISKLLTFYYYKDKKEHKDEKNMTTKRKKRVISSDKEKEKSKEDLKTLTTEEKLQLIKEIRMEKHIRPYKIVENVFSSMIEIHGDRINKDDNSIKCVLAKMNDLYVSVIYVNRRNNLKDNITANFGMINPEGYRKANRFIKLSEKMNLPIICFVDTPGANAGYEAEKNGQTIAIANLLQDIPKIKVPIISFITGEANSG